MYIRERIVFMMNKIKIFFATLGLMLLVFVLTLGRNDESLRPMFTMLIQIYLFFTMFVILIGGFFEYIYRKRQMKFIQKLMDFQVCNFKTLGLIFISFGVFIFVSFLLKQLYFNVFNASKTVYVSKMSAFLLLFLWFYGKIFIE